MVQLMNSKLISVLPAIITALESTSKRKLVLDALFLTQQMAFEVATVISFVVTTGGRTLKISFVRVHCLPMNV